jgi:SAM-dependent methyltransferase
MRLVRMEEAEFSKLAATEDRMWYFRGLHALVEWRLASAFPGATAEVLDCGCGTGGLIRRMAAVHPRWRWTGVDLSPLACAFARERTTARICEGSAMALPFDSNRFDAVVLADVLYHLDDDRKALGECHRVLRPGGCVVVNVPAHPWLWSYHDVAVHGRRRYRRAEVIEKLNAAGFTESKATHWNALLLPMIVARRKLWPAPAGGSDVQSCSPAVEALGRAALAIERSCLRAGGRFPFGSSIFASALRP